MINTLKSSELNVTVSSVGAELQSIFSPGAGKEYLWQGDPVWWPGRAPVLFPFIGASLGQQYLLSGKAYKAPRHGFVRAAYFYTVSLSENALTLEYVDNPFTRQVFPFSFTFQVTFMLNGSELRIDNRVVNHSDVSMPFLLGAHEAYSCPGFTDFYMEFENNEALESEEINLKNGLLTGARYKVKEAGGTLPLDYSLFDKDTLVFKNIASKKVWLKSRKGAEVIEVTYDAPNLAIWTKPGAAFVCIEPWYGLPGYEGESAVLAERPGAVSLPPGEEFVSTHKINVKG
jgi:galactose mutarotase-like enzyme